MKNLQELIDFLKAEKVKAQHAFKSSAVGSVQESYDFGKSHAFTLSIEKAELLFKEQLNKAHKPPLQQHGVMLSLPHDLELLEKLWYKRNPAHELNADSEKDMFWGTVACVFDDYITAVCGNAT